MKKVIENQNGVHVKLWTEDYDEKAARQIMSVSSLPFAFHHVAVMPDCHGGYGMPIGGVLAATNVIVPFAVGSDIGCGMHAVKTTLTELDVTTLKQIMGDIRNTIPVGFERRKDECITRMPKLEIHTDTEAVCPTPIAYAEWHAAAKQLGTLGQGNHFIEFQKGSDGHIWFMIHSGSRNLGKKVCDYYNGLAKEMNKKYFSTVLPEYDLAFFPMDTEEGQAYMKEMNFCLEFAKANRQLMADYIKSIICKVMNPVGASVMEEYDVHHNYAAMENHFGHNVLVHRKGATRAYKDEIGIIPGSQGTKSYIVKGLGNPDSFMSCSHGAGRKMSRSKACSSLNLEEQIKLLDDQGIVHGIRNSADLDEAPGSYKDINVVMDNQSDLVEKVVELTPLGVIKG